MAEITFGQSFLCTGTLIAPDYVLTAGHCGSITGAAVSSPAAWPAAAIDVRIGSNKPGQGELVPVSRVIVEPNYLLNSGYDITLLQLSRNSTKTPTHVAGDSAGALWAPAHAGDDRRLRHHLRGRRHAGHAAGGAGAR